MSTDKRQRINLVGFLVDLPNEARRRLESLDLLMASLAHVPMGSTRDRIVALLKEEGRLK